MAIHSVVKYDGTGFSNVLDPEVGYKYEIYGWSFDNNGTAFSQYIQRLDLIIVTGNLNLYGVYNSGSAVISYGGKWEMPLAANPYFEIPEGKYLFIGSTSYRKSGVIWYEKVSTAAPSVSTINSLSLLGIT